MFLNEIDILRGRLEYLYDKVDKFVIVDSNTTHMGVLKPDYLDCPDGHKLLQQYGDKIIRHHLVSDTSKLNYGPNLGWELDATQRAAIDDVICKFKPEDIIMIGDLDEIPSHAAIDMAIELITAKRFDAMVTLQDMFYYNFKQKQAHKCLATIICTNEYLAKGGGAQGARDRRNVMPTISEAGWHLSYFGDPESISNKIKNFAHQEFNSPEYTDVEKIRDRMISVHKTYGTNDYFNFKALPNNTKNDLVEIILAVNENILLDIGSIDENREIIEAKVFDV